MVIAKEYTSFQGQRDKKITALEYTEKGDKDSVYTYLSSFTKKYENKIGIKEDEIVYVGLDEKEREWLINSGIYMAKKITVHYKDGYGNSLKESEEYPMLNVNYHFEAPEIEGYMALNEIEEGITSGDKEITFEYCMISSNLAFIGLDSNGNETNVESDIVSYTVSGIGECNNPYLAIPRQHNGKSVTQIRKNAFVRNNIIEKLVIPDNVEKVKQGAFFNCNKLQSLNLNCKTAEEKLIFANNSNLEKVYIGKNVEFILEGIFQSCSNLNYLILYSEKFQISSSFFPGCHSLLEVRVNEDNHKYKSLDGIVYSKDGTTIYMYSLGKQEKTYIIPNNIKKLAWSSFRYNIYLKYIDIPNTVETVGNAAFFGCSNLEYATINSQRIESYAFSNNSNLKEVYIGENVEYIESYTFSNCGSLTEVNYLGTIEMWNKISKSGWNTSSSIIKVVCIDGDVQL